MKLISVNFLVNCTLFIYFFFRWISQIFFGPRRIYFCCPQHLFGRHQFVYVSRHDYCCSWRWWLKNLNFFSNFNIFAHFFLQKTKFILTKKNLKQNWVRNSRVICAFVCYTYIHLSLFQEVPKLQIWFSTKKNPEFIFFFVFYKLERIFHLLIQKLPKNLCIILTKFFWSDTIMCNPAFPFSFFSSPTLQIRYIIMKVYDTYIKYMKSCKCQKSINMIVKNKKKFAKKHCFCSSISRYYKNRRYE